MSDQQLVNLRLPSGAELAFINHDDPSRPRDLSMFGQLDIDIVLDAVREFSGLISDKIRSVAPDEFEVTFSVGVTAGTGKLGALLVSADADASFQVKLQWHRQPATD